MKKYNCLIISDHAILVLAVSNVLSSYFVGTFPVESATISR